MRFEIGQSGADINVLLVTLRGTHARPRGSVITSSVLGAVVISVVPTLLRLTIEARGTNDRLFGAGMVVLLLAFAIGIVLESLSSYQVTDDGVTKTHPLKMFSWTVDRADIFAIALELNTEWQLVVTTSSSRRRALSLEGSLRDALGKLYPEIMPVEPTPRDIRRWKWLSVVLGVVVVVVALMLWWLARQGLVSWQ